MTLEWLWTLACVAVALIAGASFHLGTWYARRSIKPPGNKSSRYVDCPTCGQCLKVTWKME